MPRIADSPLRKVTLNLYDEDCADLARLYGHGWSEKVRLLVREYLVKRRERE